MHAVGECVVYALEYFLAMAIGYHVDSLENQPVR